MRMRYRGIFKYYFAANLLESLTVEKKLENWVRINRLTAMSLVSPFLEHGV